jgi:Winged helix DNA-binding domain
MGAAPAEGADLATATADRVTAQRLYAQLLAGRPVRSPIAVAERLLAIQAQDGRGARLAVRARSRGLTAADVDAALAERLLVVNWLNRGTLHMVRSEDHGWLHALSTPTLLTGNARRLAQLGVTPAAADRAVAAVEGALAEEGPLGRRQLGERIAARRVPTEGQALIHLLMLACLRGVALRGPMVGREQAYVLVRDWLGARRPVAREKALAELAARYLAGHAPANERDLARWSGLALRDARAGLRAIAPRLHTRRDGLLELAGGRRRASTPPAARLLGAFEPLLLGWTSREAILDGNAARVVSGGLFRPFALVRGRAVATWAWRGGTVELEPFGSLDRDDARALRVEADDVRRFLAHAGSAP